MVGFGEGKCRQKAHVVMRRKGAPLCPEVAQ
jgi:hypothetical protein